MNMDIEHSLLAFIALTLSGVGVNLLYLSWRRRNDHENGMARWSGWLTLLLAQAMWCVLAGPEFGIAAGVCVPGVMAFGHILWHTRHGRRNGRNGNGRAESAMLSPVSGGGVMKRSLLNLWCFLLVVPFASLAAFFVTLGLVTMLPWTELSRVTLLVIAAPAIWGAMAGWLSSDDRQWRPILVILGLTLMSLPAGLGVL